MLKKAVSFMLTFAMVLSLSVVSCVKTGSAATLEGAGTEKNPFIACDEQTLRMIQDFPDAYWELSNSIELTSRWTPIGLDGNYFTGVLDGCGFTISGIDIYDDKGAWNNEAAFFYCNEGHIKNLHLEGTVEIHSCWLAGAMFAQYNRGIIENCSAKGIIQMYLENTHSQTYPDVAGFVMENEEGGIISNCYSRVNRNRKSAEGYSYYGAYTSGFVCDNAGIIEDCYSASGATSVTIGSKTYRPTGFTGSYDGMVSGCYFDKELANYSTSDRAEGKTTAAMKMQYNYTGWDFDIIWGINPTINDGYPYLLNENDLDIALQGIELEETEITLAEDESKTLKVIFTPNTASNKNLTWETASKYVATVDNGVVTGVSEGDTTITVTSEDGGYTAQCKVTVVPKQVSTPTTTPTPTPKPTATPTPTPKPTDEPQATSGKCGDNLTWEINGGVLTIEGSGAMYDYPYGDTPWEKYADEITQISLPTGITRIGDGAFYGFGGVKSITIPENVSVIGDEALGIYSLTKISVDAGNKYFSADNGVLFNKNKTKLIAYPYAKTNKSYSVPETVAAIEYGAFYLNNYIEELYIPESVLIIESYAISMCNNMTIYGFEGSEAQAYVESYNSDAYVKLEFVMINEMPTPPPAPEYMYEITGITYLSEMDETLEKAPENESFFIKTEFCEKSSYDGECTIIICGYDSDGRLVYTDSRSADFETGKGNTLRFYVNALNDEISSTKAFVWSSYTEQIPLSADVIK